MDSSKAVALSLLDLSAAFDTIDQNIIFNCLRDWFGVDGTVLMWIKSYLTNHRQKVKLGNSFSDAFSLPYGAPWGSVLGNFLSTYYNFQFQFTHHLYANCTQIYSALDTRNFDSSIAGCQKWMDGVNLNLNPEKQNSLPLVIDKPGSP